MASHSTSEGDLPARRGRSGLAPVTQVRAHLECTAGPEKGKTFRLAPGTTTLGRDPACEVVLSEPAVSRRHARIERRGEEWVLVNQSGNGTRLGKKNVEEAVLADQSLIGVGAKTRLVFVLEQVTISPTGRPQFRARTGGGAKPEAEEPEEEAPEQESLFQRRKKLFIGLGAYLGGILLLLVVGLILTGAGGSGRHVVRLGLEDMVRLPDGEMLRISRRTPDGGVWAEDRLGQPHKITREQIRSGGYAYIPGIRNALLKNTFEARYNRGRAAYLRDQALALYDQRDADPANLYRAVRAFQQSLACSGGRTFFAEPVVNKIYDDAVNELVKKVHDAYTDAQFYETARDFGRARAQYRHILEMIPARTEENRVVRNVSEHLAALPKVKEKSAWD